MTAPATFRNLPWYPTNPPPLPPPEICDHCGKKVCHEPRKVARHTVDFMCALMRRGGKITRMSEVAGELSATAYSTGALARLWGLVVSDSPEATQRGHWKVTARGMKFLAGDAKVPRTNVARGVIPQWYEGPLISVHEVVVAPDEYEDYAERIRKALGG